MSSKANADIRNYISSLNLSLWEIAEWLGIKSQESLMHFIYWSRLLGNAVVTFIFSFIAYRRLKKMQY